VHATLLFQLGPVVFEDMLTQTLESDRAQVARGMMRSVSDVVAVQNNALSLDHYALRVVHDRSPRT